MNKSPQALDAVVAELNAARGVHAAYDAHLDALASRLRDASPVTARATVEHLALALQAAALAARGDAVAEAFCAARLAEGAGSTYGAGPAVADTQSLIERSLPTL